jgi:hypothetical protein
MTIWFTDIRRVALIAFVLSVVSSLIALRDITRKLSDIAFTHPQATLWIASGTVLVYLVAAILSAFYFALYRDTGILHFPKRLRLLALAAALASGVILVTGLPAWIGSLANFITASSLEWSTGAASVSALARDPATMYQLTALVGEFASVAQILLLIAFFRLEGNPSTADTPTSSFLRWTTKVTVIVWALVMAAALVRLAAVPISFPQIRELAMKAGRTPPLFADLMGDAARFFVSEFSLFAAPYIVYRSWSARSKNPEANAQDAVQVT